jgi:hypothetical protein
MEIRGQDLGAGEVFTSGWKVAMANELGRKRLWSMNRSPFAFWIQHKPTFHVTRAAQPYTTKPLIIWIAF